MFKFKLTAAQDILLQGVLSALASALLGALAAGVQQITAHGLDWNVLITVLLTSFAGLFGTSLKNFVPSHVQQELQSYKDLTQQLQTMIGLQQQTAPTVKRASIASPPLQPIAPAYVSPQQAPMQGNQHGG